MRFAVVRVFRKLDSFCYGDFLKRYKGLGLEVLIKELPISSLIDSCNYLDAKSVWKYLDRLIYLYDTAHMCQIRIQNKDTIHIKNQPAYIDYDTIYKEYYRYNLEQISNTNSKH